MGRDANNQMYPLAWVVVRVETAENWKWFLALVHDDLSLNYGNGITVISYSHKVILIFSIDSLPFYNEIKFLNVVFSNHDRVCLMLYLSCYPMQSIGSVLGMFLPTSRRSSLVFSLGDCFGVQLVVHWRLSLIITCLKSDNWIRKHMVIY